MYTIFPSRTYQISTILVCIGTLLFLRCSTEPSFTWVRHFGNPILPAVQGTWYEAQTANPDLLRVGETYFLYFRGQKGGHDRIGVATIPV